MAKRKAAPAATKRAKTRRTGVATRRAKGARTKAAPKRRATASRTTSKKAVRPAKKAAATARKASRPQQKKAASRKAAVRKGTVRKATVRKATTRKPAAQQKAVVRKVAVRKTAPRKAAARNPSPRPAVMLAKPAPKTAKVAPPLARRKPALDRARRTIADDDSIPSSLDLDRTASSARSGRHEIAEHARDLTQTGPEITAGDVDADWESAYNVGDEAPGGDNPTPDQDVVEEIGQALGMVYEDAEELDGEGKISGRDTDRWELDPESSDDFDERD